MNTKSMLRPVENHFSPLTPKHGFPSLNTRLRALPLSPPHVWNIASLYRKTGENLMWFPPEKSYDFLRRHYPHQVKGSKVHPSAQPVNTSSPVFQLSKQKPETPVLMPPVEKLRTMTSYGGITRIRLKGRSWMTSSQPACTSSPVFVCKSIIYRFFHNCKYFLV